MKMAIKGITAAVTVAVPEPRPTFTSAVVAAAPVAKQADTASLLERIHGEIDLLNGLSGHTFVLAVHSGIG